MPRSQRAVRSPSLLSRLFLFLVQVPLYLWLGAKLMLDAMGRASVLADLSDDKSTSGRILVWVVDGLIHTPWYLPALLAGLVTAAWLFFMFRFHNVPVPATASAAPTFHLQPVSPAPSVQSLLPLSARAAVPPTVVLPEPFKAIIDTSEDGKPWANKPLTYFSSLIKTENRLQAEAMILPYVGTLISFLVRLSASNINRVENVFFSVGGTLTDGTSVICRFPMESEKYLARLDLTQDVEITGTLARPLGMSLVIDGCHPKR